MMVSFQVLFCMLLLSCLYRAAASGVKAIWWDAKGDPWWPLFRVGRESKLPPDFTAHDSLHSSSCKKLAIRRSSHVTLLSYGLSTGNWGSKINRIFSRVLSERSELIQRVARMAEGQPSKEYKLLTQQKGGNFDLIKRGNFWPNKRGENWSK